MVETDGKHFVENRATIATLRQSGSLMKESRKDHLRPIPCIIPG